MPTLIIPPHFNSDAQYLSRMATQAGWDVHRAVRYQAPGKPEDACCYGDLAFCDAMARRASLALLDPLDDWLAHLPERFLKREVSFMRLYDAFRIRERRFIKPANDKLFHAQVYESGEDIPMTYVSATCPVLVSEIVSFDAEVRCYVLDRKVLTASTYHRAAGLSIDTTKGGAAWLRLVLEDYEGLLLPSAVVVDVGLIHGRGWAVIEANQAYASGVYDEADGTAVLQVVQRSAGHQSKVKPEDQPFIRRRQT